MPPVCGRLFHGTRQSAVYGAYRGWKDLSDQLHCQRADRPLLFRCLLYTSTQLTKDYKVLVTSRPVTAQVITNLDLNLSHEQLVRKIKVDNPTDTRILTISVEDTDPYKMCIRDSFQVDDILMNSIGTVIGCAVFLITAGSYRVCKWIITKYCESAKI